MAAMKKKIAVVTVTCEEASMRHKGLDSHYFSRMCLKGKALAKRYGGASKVPVKKAATVLFATKVGKYWHIPVSELNRMFSLTSE